MRHIMMSRPRVRGVEKTSRDSLENETFEAETVGYCKFPGDSDSEINENRTVFDEVMCRILGLLFWQTAVGQKSNPILACILDIIIQFPLYTNKTGRNGN